jgi:crotonobetainyl-CoA:carnitine CoA-transferase CaiB-like acyl-CoA transferase
MSRVLAGPWASMTLGDLGANIIKIENPDGGDVTRDYPPFWNGQSTYYLSANRNKRSITLDLEVSESREVIRKMVSEADILIEAFRNGAMEGWGLGWEDLHALNPRLIYCAVSGHGRTGPDKDRAGVDLLMQAYSGLMSVTGEPGRTPVRTGTSVVDLAAGANAVQGILAALYVREKTGVGQRVDVSLLGSVVSWMSYHLTAYFGTGNVPQPMGAFHPSVAPYGTYPTRDGFLVLAVALDSSWRRFCNAVGRPELIDHPNLRSNALRIENRAELDEHILAILAERSAPEWSRLLDAAGVAASEINTIDTVVEIEQVKHQELIVPIPHSEIPELKVPGIAVKLESNPGSIRLPPPKLGEHSEEILREFGFSDPDIQTLRAQGALG